MSKNKFTVFGDTIEITRPEWDFIAMATVRNDYLEEIQSVTWGLQDNRYLYNGKLGTLHSYIMKKWYGEDVCLEMKNKGYVIDHMDNDSHNCCINNLSFLSHERNLAKGLTLDHDSKEKSFIALTLFKDFTTGLFQISIMFNYPAVLDIRNFEHYAVVEQAYLLYEGDYRKVITDAESILNDYYQENYTFKPDRLRFIDYQIEGCTKKVVTPDRYKEYLEGRHGHAVVYFVRLAQIKNWTKDNPKKFFAIKDYDKKQTYLINLDM